MQKIESLEYGHTYHLFNRGVNGTDLFLNEANYKHFLALYDQYISLVADTYAWVLMRNHLHLLVRIKEESEILPLSVSVKSDTVRCKHTDRSRPDSVEDLSVSARESAIDWNTRKPVPYRQFSHLFNAYSKYFNTHNHRHGSLFETPFKRIRVESKEYFRRLVYYIHHNPVKHGFAEHILDWGWSSYLTLITVKPTRLHRETVLGYFDDAANFKVYHQQTLNLEDINDLLLE